MQDPLRRRSCHDRLRSLRRVVSYSMCEYARLGGGSCGSVHLSALHREYVVFYILKKKFGSDTSAGNPSLNLQTTYKARCYRGLNHANPSSSEACHKAARGDYSKYCSDECGIAFMKTKIDTWAKNGGDKSKLWESVKHAER